METILDGSRDYFWYPTPEIANNAHLFHFMQANGLSDFYSLLNRSTEDVPWFTRALLEYLDIRFYQPYSRVLDLSRGPEWPQWCVDGKMNIVHNCLDKRIGTPSENQLAMDWESESGGTRRMTYGELFRKVNQAANALRSLGISKGDPVGLFMPMIPEIAIALLAIAKVGGIILPLFSGYGAGAVATRLADAGAKAVFTADGFTRRGRPVEMKAVVDEAASTVPTLQHVIIVDYSALPYPLIPGRDHRWRDLVECQSDQSDTEVTAAEDTLMLIYTSGTTGRPKGTIHTHCGFPIKASQDMAFGTDVHPGETIYWVTDMGWMMGPWELFGALVLGAAFFMYDGAPDYPAPDRLWSMVERHNIHKLGISPTLIRALIPYGDEQFSGKDLSSLRLLSLTGEPCNPEPWRWLFEKVGHSRLPIINYSGGTEISGGILMSNPLLPMKPCSFNAPCPGMAVDVLDEHGHSLVDQVGELVIKTPWIGMTRGFWKDPERYLETYWSHWPGVWVHGDWAAVDQEGQWYVFGRSDDTIKIAGKRLGPAEVESILVEHPAVLESAAIGVPDPIKGNRMVIFVVLKPGFQPSDPLRSELIDKVINDLGKALAPHRLFFVEDLPKTRNAKVMRRMVRSTYLEMDPGDRSSLVNPESLESIQHAH
ncbi:MAG: AMP-binding protein [Anaerolineaceae bacterium]|nr:AMP-binding protein [Anaerolineaceae bacterium]